MFYYHFICLSSGCALVDYDLTRIEAASFIRELRASFIPFELVLEFVGV